MSDKLEYLLAFVERTLWTHAVLSESYFSIDDFLGNLTFRFMKSLKLNKGQAQILFDHYEEKGDLIKRKDPVMGIHYKLSGDFSKKVFELSQIENSIHWRAKTYGSDFFEKALDGIDIDAELDNLQKEALTSPDSSRQRIVTSAPASDRTVTLTDNQVEEAATRIEDFIREFRQDHHFGNEWAAEKDVLIKALEAGKTYLEHKVIEVRIATIMIIEPLKEVVEKYAPVVAAETVRVMAQDLIRYLIDLFKNGLG